MSVFRHTPLPQTRQAHRQPSPLKRVEFASKLQEKMHAANAAEHRENFAARKIQPRPAVKPDMTECGTSQKNEHLSKPKTTAAETANSRLALVQNALNRLADAIASIRISLKAKKVGLNKKRNFRPCTGVRDKDGRAYAPIRINIIYMMSNVCFGMIFCAKARKNLRFDAPRRSFCLFFAKQG